jgi:hypothetical protein
VLTFQPGYLFRTPPGVNLLVRGPVNVPKDGITALEGLVETDWLPMPFTMNWRLTRPGTVVFEPGEVFCTILPYPRGYAESYRPELRDLARDDPALLVQVAEWQALRQDALSYNPGPPRGAAGTGGYMRGQNPDGSRFAGHQTKIALARFQERRLHREQPMDAWPPSAS